MTFSDLPKVEGLNSPRNISTEEYREYVWADTGNRYRIDNPIGLYTRDGGTTHRVVTVDGTVHCVPCGPLHPNTVIIWKNKDTSVPVNF